MTVRLERLPDEAVPWDELHSHPETSIFSTRAWSRFLAESQGAEPVVATVRCDGESVGWFTGAIVRRFGFRVLGAPLPGWTTSYMGFVLDRTELRTECVPALRRFAFRGLGCVHLEVMDRRFDSSVRELKGMSRSDFHSFDLPLAEDDVMLAAMSQGARRNIRRAAANGITVEEVDPMRDAAFVDEYYFQVTQAFAKRGLTPTYDVERVRSMVRHLHPTGDLVLLRARTADGESAATGLFPGRRNGTAVYWMAASERHLQHLRPNEAMVWRALQTWRDRGATRFDFGGGGDFKTKFGPEPIVVPWLRCSRLPLAEPARTALAAAVRRAQRRGSAPPGGG